MTSYGYNPGRTYETVTRVTNISPERVTRYQNASPERIVTRYTTASPERIVTRYTTASPERVVRYTNVSPERVVENRYIVTSRDATNKSLIFNSDYTRSMNSNYHVDHFACWNCDQSLSGSRYILRDDRPHCLRCYEELFSHVCEECKKRIGTDSKDLSYKDKHWHEKCFFCSVCKSALVDKPFGSKNDELFCGECYNQRFASRCDRCNQVFKPGMKKMEYRGQQFHENCFNCSSCNNAIGTRSFIPKDGRAYCLGCYEEQFAVKCVACSRVVSQGGVTYKNQPFHRECFTCHGCHESLAGLRFTSRDDHPYCSDCFGRLFARKCYKCVKPITGIGGTKYISFEDRHWHNDCFTCNRCQSSLVGRGFITENNDVLCPDCGRY